MNEVPDRLERRIAVLLRVSVARAEQMGEEALRPLGLSGREYGVLAALEHGGVAGSQTQLGASLGFDRTTTMKLMAGLVDRGLVRREPDPQDRRSYRSTVTAVGRRLLARADLVLDDCDAALTAGRLSVEESRVLQDLLRRIV